MLRKTIIGTVLIAALGTAAPAMAATIPFNPDGSVTISSGTAVGDTFTVDFDGSESGSVIPGLTSSLTLTFQGISGNDYLFGYNLANTSSAPTTSSAVTAFGFNIDPSELLSSASVDGTFQVLSSGQVSEGYNLEMCFKNGQNNNCAGSPGNQGINLGTSGSGTITMGFSSLPQSVTLSDYLVRYQAVNGSGSAVGTPVGSVPEPGTWALMLLGFGAIGVSMRSKRRMVPLAQIA